MADLKTKRLRRQLISPDHLGEFESQKLWSKVSLAIQNEDQVCFADILKYKTRYFCVDSKFIFIY